MPKRNVKSSRFEYTYNTDKSECLLDKKARKQKYTCTYEAVFMNKTFYLC